MVENEEPFHDQHKQRVAGGFQAPLPQEPLWVSSPRLNIAHHRVHVQSVQRLKSTRIPVSVFVRSEGVHPAFFSPLSKLLFWLYWKREEKYYAATRFSKPLLSYCLNPRLSSGTTDSSWGVNKVFSLVQSVAKTQTGFRVKFTLKYESCAIMQLFGICWRRLWERVDFPPLVILEKTKITETKISGFTFFWNQEDYCVDNHRSLYIGHDTAYL